MLGLGFISIRQYRNISHGIGGHAIIAVPRDRTISCMNARVACALLTRHKTNSQQHSHKRA